MGVRTRSPTNYLLCLAFILETILCTAAVSSVFTAVNNSISFPMILGPKTASKRLAILVRSHGAVAVNDSKIEANKIHT